MKKYIKSLGLFALLGVLPILGLYMLLNKAGIRPLLTDSVSFDVKADAIADANIDQLDVLGLGSSISLNNLGSKAIQDYIGDDFSYYNFSSWGLTMKDLNVMIPVLVEKYQPKVLIIASGPMDFERQKVGMCDSEEYRWYIEGKNTSYFYAKNTDMYGLIQRKRTVNKYTSHANPEQRIHLLFDEWGGCNLTTKKENYQWFRYNDNLMTETVDEQYEELRKICAFTEKKDVKLIFVISPMKKDPNCVDQDCKDFVKNHIARARKLVESEGQLFLDLHSYHSYPDSLFCDESHLVHAGPDRFSQEILKVYPIKAYLSGNTKALVQQ